MRDLDIRTALSAQILAEHPEGDAQIFHEFGVAHGAARIDVGLLNGSLEGFEIKSDRDTLRRLPAQAQAYNRVFDLIWIVTSRRHIDRLRGVVPEWWGIRQAHQTPAGVEITVVREARPNPKRQALGLAQLLWRDELLAALARRGLDEGRRSKTKPELQRALADALGVEEMALEVRQALKYRDWRSD